MSAHMAKPLANSDRIVGNVMKGEVMTPVKIFHEGSHFGDGINIFGIAVVNSRQEVYRISDINDTRAGNAEVVSFDVAD